MKSAKTLPIEWHFSEKDPFILWDTEEFEKSTDPVIRNFVNGDPIAET